MTTTIITIGNSLGIRIPKIAFEESGLDKKVELEVKKGEIRILSVKMRKKKAADTLLMSEDVLGIDWNKPEEDEAWKSLQ